MKRRAPIARRSPPKRKKRVSRRPVKASKRFKAACDYVFRWAIRERDGWTCRRCGWGEPPPTRRVQCAHIITRGRGAIRCDPENAVALCDKCHAYFSKRDSDGHEWREWVELHVGADRIPALRVREKAKDPDWQLLLMALVPWAREVGVLDETMREGLMRELRKDLGLEVCGRLGLVDAA